MKRFTRLGEGFVFALNMLAERPVVLKVLFVLVLSLFPFSANAESILFGSKLVFNGPRSTGMFEKTDLTGSDLRASTFGDRIDRTVAGILFSGTSGTDGISWTGAQAGLGGSGPNSREPGLDDVLSAGINLFPTIDITVIPGQAYDIQLLAFSSFAPLRRFDISVDGVLFADDFTVLTGDHIIYNFGLIADGDGFINIRGCPR